MGIVLRVPDDLISDRYQLIDVIASGGMATVWRARDTRLDRIVAIKRPHPAPPDDPGMLRMEREARIAASVSHPNLVTVFDTGRDESGPFMVMEIVEGELLNTAAVDMERREIVAMTAEVADALAAIHEAGIVHRDVKPSNVMMSERGPLLTDFGIALVSGSEDRLTRTGDVVATPSYAAPEVLSGAEPTPSADVYSFALMVYELMSGRLAFPGSDRSVPPPPLADAHLEAILRPAMSDDPAVRPTAGELAVALRGSAPTQVLGGVAAASATTAVMETKPTPVEASQEIRQPTSGTRHVATLLVMAGLALAGVVAVASLTDNATDAAGVSSTEPTSVATTVPSATTTPTTTPTTVPPTTTATTIADPVLESRDRFAAVLEEVRPSELKPKDKRELIDKVDEVITNARDGREKNAAKQLEDLSEKVEDKLDDEPASLALNALADLADALGLPIEEADD